MVADFRKKGNSEFFNGELLFKTVGIIFLVVIFVLAVADFKIYQKKKDLTAQINSYKKQIEDIKGSSKTLKNEIANANNKDYLEKLGYEQFNQTKPGETEYMFIKSAKKIEAASVPNNFWNANFLTKWLFSAVNWIKSRF